MLKDKFGGDLYFKYLMNINRVFLTMEMCVAKARMHSICMCWMVGWVGLGSGISN